MKRAIQMMCVVVVSVGLSSTVTARTVTYGGTSISMDFVDIGNAGNGPDSTTIGSVAYTYRIGKYEVSKNQWDLVVAASAIDLLDDPGQWSDDQPVANISWYDAAMFCNWLTSGDVTDGAYTINGSGEVTAIDRDFAVNTHGTVYVIPTEDEWYKAAYHKNDGKTGNYHAYPSDNIISPDGIDFAGDTQFDFVFKDPYQQGIPNAVNNAGDLSPYDTMGQGGNIWEW
ncbi:MAG: SUMF1/EgtB/PvdO family nonheme iron enzyme, partial [Planctomycetes bacterium]|nr:SUMF1/EgtB/PvdO family nonheme iron enzyme [Planctomycetota bacterium]